MNISVVTLFPDLYKPFVQTSLIGRAQEQGLISCDVSSLFSYAKPKERIDAPTFGHDPGMLIRPEIVEKAVTDKESKHGKAFKIFFSPHGKKLDQRLLESLAQRLKDYNHLMLLPARYEGMDARVEQKYADEIVSVGDFVLMGGDIPAMVLLEGLTRLIPGVVGKQESVTYESFTGPFVDYPEYTAPVEWQGMKVPDVLRSGDHAAIKKWREHQAVERTVKDHFGWLRSQQITPAEKKMVRKQIPPHYAVLMHTDVALGDDRVGTSSVTSFDIHDIARSSCTYGLEKFFLVTPLKDQQKIVQELLNFWQTGKGVSYNSNRHNALKNVKLEASFDDVLKAIAEKEGKEPLVIATSAKVSGHQQLVSYYDQAAVWQHDRPVVLVFGTAQGLSSQFLERCDYLLAPLYGFSDFNHLSVRSAAAIIFDRWLGINPKEPKRRL